MSIADKFVFVMAQVHQMDADMPDFAVDRYAVWSMRDAAKAAITEGLFAAVRCVDSARMIRQAGNDARQEAAERINQLETALRLAADEPNIDRARVIADAALKREAAE